MERAISLLYHDVVAPGGMASSGFHSAEADLYKLEEPMFLAHLDAISARVTRTSQLFTFDDGGASAVRTGDLLSMRGWRGLFFIPTDFIDTSGFVTSGDLRVLAAQGHAIGSHSASHPLRMAALPRPRLLQEWGDSRKRLQDVLGSDIRLASIPGGYYSKAVAETAAAAGYSELFTSEPVTRPWCIDTLVVRGRYSVQQSTPAAAVAAIAAGAWTPRAYQFAFWTFKKLLKRAGGDYWLRFRASYLRLRQAP